MHGERGAAFLQRDAQVRQRVVQDLLMVPRWNDILSRIEMHLCSTRRQIAAIDGARIEVRFDEGETIWTESSYKYTAERVVEMAAAALVVAGLATMGFHKLGASKARSLGHRFGAEREAGPPDRGPREGQGPPTDRRHEGL